MSFLGDTTLSLIQRGLDVGLKRQLVLSSNVANLDTPNYTPGDVDFEAALGAVSKTSSVSIARTEAGHMTINGGAEEIRTTQTPDRQPSLDGNSVDLDSQMARLSQNGVAYQANIKAISKKLALLKYATSEGAM
ncbi:MAG: flagellar basal body rod protein FlgB [bacterium]